MNVQVVTACSRFPDRSQEPYYRPECMIESLRRYGEVAVNICANGIWDGLMTKPFRLREWLRRGRNVSDRILFVDAFDVLFVRHPHWIGDRCEEWFGADTIVFNGERNLWPRSDLKDYYDALAADGPWKYLNSGFMCGPADRILQLLEAMDIDRVGLDRIDTDGTRHEPNDQGEFQYAFTRQPVPMAVDSGCRVAMTFSATEADDYELVNQELHNKITGSSPGLAHFNGDGMNRHFDFFLEHWGLP